MNRHRDLLGTEEDAPPRSWYVAFRCDWADLNPWAKVNWRNFTLVHLTFEYAKYSGRWELEMGLLGLCARVTHIFDQAFNDMMKDQKTQIMNELRRFTGATEVVDLTGGELDRVTRERQ